MSKAAIAPPSVPSDQTVASASAPGSIGNFGPGLDIIGCAVTGLRDTVHARLVDRPGIHLEDSGHADLPRDAGLHASTIAASQVVMRASARGHRIQQGISLSLRKQLPLSGGQGGSAASAVAGALATNALLGDPLNRDEILLAALAAESLLAGSHLDNIAPALLGGIVLIRRVDPPEIVRLGVPAHMRLALVRPEQELRTADARAVLPREVSRKVALTQAANVATLVWALDHGDLELLGRAIDDQIAEPARAVLLPGFLHAKRAALDAGALGCSISGAGPTSFAITSDDDTAERVIAAMRAAYADHGLAASGRIARVDERGAVAERGR